MKQVAARTLPGVEEINSQFKTSFSMTSCLNSNIMSSIGWYVGNGALRQMTYEMSLFNSRIMLSDLNL